MTDPALFDPPVLTHSTMQRVINTGVILALTWLEWIVQMTHPAQNAGNWLAAAAGAFVIRLVLPAITIRLSVSAWLGGFLFAILFASSLAKHHFFAGWDSMAVWGAVALGGDFMLQLVAFIIRLAQKLTGYTLEHPGAAFDETLERAEKVTTVWVRIKAPLLDLINSILPKKP